MSILIGHASIDENRSIKNGEAGDQTGKEVCIRNWYSSNWSYVLRCKDKNKAEIMAKACEAACNNPYIGYDQNERNNLYKVAKVYNFKLESIKILCECDCSSLMAVCAECAGIKVYKTTNAPTTATMKDSFSSTGLFEVLSDTRYLNTDSYLMRGDILVKSGHTVMVLGNGSCLSKQNTNTYIIGRNYILNANMYIRKSPAGDKAKYEEITANARSNAYKDSEGNAILKKGTEVTCKDIKEKDNKKWIKIPSGWVCSVDGDKIYIV